ncbi:MAG: type II secretion system F family protein [Phototrophicaceae bacterium]
MVIGIAIVVILIIVGILVYMGLREDSDYDPLNERMAEFAINDTPTSLTQLEMSLSFKDRVFVPLVKRLADLTRQVTPEKQLESARKKLDMAGMAGEMEPSAFFLMRIVATVVLGLGAFFLFFVASKDSNPLQAMGFTVGAVLMGFYLPVMWINGKISRRQQEIVKALPDALDLLVICVEAGLGFDAAMGKVYEKWDNDLSVAFGRVLREVQLGKGRRDAMKDMSERLAVPDVTTFVAAIIQADTMGVSMAHILRVQSEQMRIKRRQRAQEKAQGAPVKMMIPLALLIFPSIWVVLLGPAILKVKSSGALGVF